LLERVFGLKSKNGEKIFWLKLWLVYRRNSMRTSCRRSRRCQTATTSQFDPARLPSGIRAPFSVWSSGVSV
jgi:hypothetical protein